MNAFPILFHANGNPMFTHLFLWNLQYLTQILIGESILLGSCQKFIGRKSSFVLHQTFFFLHQFLHLLDKPYFYLCQLMDFFHIRTFSQGLIHNEMAVAAGGNQKPHQFFLGHMVIVLCVAQPIASCFQTADRFLEGLLIGLSNAHNFAYGSHLCSQFIFNTFKLFKGPACKFNHNIIAVRHIFIQCSILTAGNFLQCQSCCQHR